MNNMNKIKKIVIISMFSSVAAILMIFDFPIPIAPSFMKIDLSEVPIMIIAYMLGPISGIISVFLKIIIKLILKTTSTYFVGEIANFISAVSFIVPSSLLYKKNKNIKIAIISLIFGIFISSVVSTFFNAFILFPFYINNMGYGYETLINMYKNINPNLDSMLKIMLLSVFPFNIIKYTIVSIIIFFIYKKISKVIRSVYNE